MAVIKEIRAGAHVQKRKSVFKSDPESGTPFWRLGVVTVCSGVAASSIEDASAPTPFKEADDSREEGLNVPPEEPAARRGTLHKKGRA